MAGELPESYDEWQTRHEANNSCMHGYFGWEDCPECDVDIPTRLERAIDKQIELERTEEAEYER